MKRLVVDPEHRHAMRSKVVLLSVDEILTFGKNEATLLGQVNFWLNKANKRNPNLVRIEGYEWIAKSRSSLREETALTDQQLRTALERLRGWGILISERHLHQNKITAHFRIDQERRQAMIAQSSLGRTTRTNLGAKTQIDLGGKTQNIDSETLLEPLGEYGSAIANQLSGKNDNFTGKGYIRGGGCHANQQVTLESVKSVGQLADLWRKAWSETRENFLPPFTAMQNGQLKMAATRSEVDKPGVLIDWTVRNWSTFTAFAAQQQAAINPPANPETGFLLKYIASAVDAHKASQAAPAKAPITPTPAPTAPTMALEPEEETMPIEEAQKLWGISED